jgi:hypothetical protein
VDSEYVDTSLSESVSQTSTPLTCVHCGSSFKAPAWPRVRCPQCGMLGHPDRAGLNLLPLGWECQTCHTMNDGTTNFCLSCGAGLASRCLRCESPVYKSICDRCGAHQERLQQYMAAETRRATWTPLLRAHIQQQRAQMQAEEMHQAATEVIREWRQIDVRPEAGADAQRRASSPGPKRRNFWGWIWVFTGVTLLLLANREQVVSMVSSTPLGQGRLVAMGNAAQQYLRGRWVAFEPSLSRLGQLSPGDPEYAYLFVTALFLLALLPVLLYVIKRLVERLLP